MFTLIKRVGFYAKICGTALNVGTGIYQAGKGVKDGEPKEIVKGVTGIGTRFFGGLGGEAVGATIGTVICPFFGIGFFVGGVLGGVAGSKAASKAGDALIDLVADNRDSDDAEFICHDCLSDGKRN